MTTLSKSLLAFAVVGALAGLIAFFGLSPFGKQIIQQTFGSPVGSTFSTSKFAAVAVNLANVGANGTSTSILNTDTSDRYPISIDLGCEGVGTSQTAYSGTGLAALTLSVATSSTANPLPSNANTNYVGAATLVIPTSTVQVAISSSTAALPGNTRSGVVWGAGTYMTFTFNATNTAACSVGVKYIAS